MTELNQVLNWSIVAAEIQAKGLDEQRLATPDERVALSKALALLGCDRIELRYRVKGLAGGRYRLQGTLKADVVQACIVSLDPVREAITVPLDVEFRPQDDTAELSEGDIGDPLADDDFELIENGALPIGRVVYDEIASGLNPYPRAAGVEMEVTDTESIKSDTPSGPFAKLAALRPKSEPKP